MKALRSGDAAGTRGQVIEDDGTRRARGEARSLDVEHTRRLGRAIGRAAQPGALVALDGPLGAGKTQLAKGIAEGLGVRSVVNSPTFVLMNEHEGRLHLFHVDAYRLGGAEEAEAAGLIDDRQLSGITVVEWAERIASLLPHDRLEIAVRPVASARAGGSADGRVLEWRATGPRHEALAAALSNASSSEADR
jgi:tRNA threonylcarbamoyladenosine biosynthesis protein TsaE